MCTYYKCKMEGGDVSPQCFVKDLLWVVNLVCKKEDSVYCWFKAHQPRQAQRPSGRLFFVVLDHSFLSTFKVKCHDFLQDLTCTCKGKAVCSSGCVCFEQGLSCTDICPCQASEICRNSNTQMSRNKSIDGERNIQSLAGNLVDKHWMKII
jgi:hypothetical protein